MRYFHEAVVWVGTAVYKTFVRPFLFAISWNDAERAHKLGILALRFIGWFGPLRWFVSLVGAVRDERLSQIFFQKVYHNPVGLAAGFDKYAEAIAGLAACGFGSIEIGGITPEAEPGNPRPRMFRLWRDRGIINRMKFNNPGAAATRKRLMQKTRVPVGLNASKAPVTPLNKAANDCCVVVYELYGCVDYIVINLSSPNSPGLRNLQREEHLDPLLFRIRGLVDGRADAVGGEPKMLLLKIDPDRSWDELDVIIEVCVRVCIGIVIGNTTTNRKGLKTKINQAGGLSWPGLKPRVLEVVRYIRARVPDDFVIIGVGGIFTAQDAYDMLKAGANLVQLLTSFVYEGPFVAARINIGLLRLMERDGIRHVSELHRAV